MIVAITRTVLILILTMVAVNTIVVLRLVRGSQ
jgi:hypothetical protein